MVNLPDEAEAKRECLKAFQAVFQRPHIVKNFLGISREPFVFQGVKGELSCLEGV
jgi:hypothetical protein